MANHHASQSPVVVVMVPLLSQGHINQLLHLSRRISDLRLPVYFTGTDTLIRQAKTRVHGWDPSSSPTMHFHEFPTPESDDPPPNPNTPSKFPTHLAPFIMAAVLSLRGPVYAFVDKLARVFKKVVVVYDKYMSYVVQDIRFIHNVEAYRFYCVSAFNTFWFNWKNEKELPISPEVVGVLDECPSSEDGLFSPEFIEFMAMQISSPPVFSGHIYDTNRVIEPLYIELIEKQSVFGAQRVWALGPLNPTSIPEQKTRHKCLEWLDKQEPDSVIFISFGTTVSFTDENIKEIALGLERSSQKFIWVLRDADRGDVSTNVARKTSDILPTWLENKLKDVGLILTDWVPQLEILAHSATGGFMSHCGWNSCSESITMGVPIATWPMHSDQPMNAALITKGLRIGVEVVNWERRAEQDWSDRVEKAVRKLMASGEGDKMRNRARELGVSVRKSFMEGGVARKEFDSFIAHIVRSED